MQYITGRKGSFFFQDLLQLLFWNLLNKTCLEYQIDRIFDSNGQTFLKRNSLTSSLKRCILSSYPKIITFTFTFEQIFPLKLNVLPITWKKLKLAYQLNKVAPFRILNSSVLSNLLKPLERRVHPQLNNLCKKLPLIPSN